MKRLFLVLTSLIVFSLFVHSQERFSIFLSAGSSTLKEVDNDSGSSYGNFYTNSFAIRTGIDYKILKNRTVFPTAGLSLSAKGAKNNFPESYGSPIVSDSWLERYYTADATLKLKYAFEPWLLLNCGFTGSVPFSYPSLWEKNEVPFSYLSFCTGFDIRIKKIYLSFDYCLGLTPTRNFPWADIHFNERTWTAGVGYRF